MRARSGAGRGRASLALWSCLCASAALAHIPGGLPQYRRADDIDYRAELERARLQYAQNLEHARDDWRRALLSSSGGSLAAAQANWAAMHAPGVAFTEDDASSLREKEAMEAAIDKLRGGRIVLEGGMPPDDYLMRLQTWRYPGSANQRERVLAADAHLAMLQHPWIPEALHRVTLPNPYLQLAMHPGGPNLDPLYIRPDLQPYSGASVAGRVALPYALPASYSPWNYPEPFAAPGVDPALIAAAGAANDGAYAAAAARAQGLAMNRFAGLTEVVGDANAWPAFAAARQASVADAAATLLARNAAADARQRERIVRAMPGAVGGYRGASGPMLGGGAQRSGGGSGSSMDAALARAAAAMLRAGAGGGVAAAAAVPLPPAVDAATLAVDRAHHNAGVGVDLQALPAPLRDECAGAANLPLCLRLAAAASAPASTALGAALPEGLAAMPAPLLGALAPFERFPPRQLSVAEQQRALSAAAPAAAAADGGGGGGTGGDLRLAEALPASTDAVEAERLVALPAVGSVAVEPAIEDAAASGASRMADGASAMQALPAIEDAAPQGGSEGGIAEAPPSGPGRGPPASGMSANVASAGGGVGTSSSASRGGAGPAPRRRALRG